MSAGFEAARRAAVMSDLLAVLAGRPTDLLPFETVRRELGLRHLVDRGIQQVPLDRIVGTLGRPGEFNRAFLPRAEGLRDRWDRLKSLAEGPEGFPPVELNPRMPPGVAVEDFEQTQIPPKPSGWWTRTRERIWRNLRPGSKSRAVSG